MNDQKMILSERLKKARESLGKSQKEIANLLGISFRAWQGYELGNNVPGSSVIEGLVKIGFNANWLLTGEGGMKKTVSFKKSGWMKVVRFKNREFLGALDENVFVLTHKVILDYQDEIGRLLKPDAIGKLLYLLAFFIISPQEDEKKTEKEIKRVLEIILDILKRYLVFKKMNFGPNANIALLSFLEDSDSMYNEIQNENIDGVNKGEKYISGGAFNRKPGVESAE